MSLFEDDRYTYCDTFFVYMSAQDRPSLDAVKQALDAGSEKYQMTNEQADSDGLFKSITIQSPHDSSGMDIVFVAGPEVQEQVAELLEEFRQISLEGDDFHKLKEISSANARLDVFHFERNSESEDLAMLDPGGLFLIIDKLNRICRGIGLDPQSKTLI